MEVTTVKYSCDYCENEMSKFEYEKAIKITLVVDLPNPKGGCGQHAGIRMVLCDTCSEKIGIVNSEEYHKYTYSQFKLTQVIEKYKTKILDLFKKD